MNRRTSLVLMFVGMSVLVSGYHLRFLRGTVGKGDYDVEGGAVLQLSWYLEEGDRTEGGFTVSGGNEEVRFYIENPFGVIIYDAGIVKTRLSSGFTAGVSGIYSFYFENLDLSDKVIHANFRSPYEPKARFFFEFILSLSMMFGGTAILICGVAGLVATKQKENKKGEIRTTEKPKRSKAKHIAGAS